MFYSIFIHNNIILSIFQDKLQVMKHVLFSINIVVVSLTLILLFILQKYKFFNQVG